MTLSFIKKIVIATAGALVLASAAFAASDLESRLAPVGSVCMAGDDCAAAKASGGGEPREASAVYNSGCLACHASGAAGAPKTGDAAAWSARVDEKGLDVLYKNAYEGYKGMPAKGLCGDCSEDEIKGAVDYILANSK